jgi:protein TonB
LLAGDVETPRDDVEVHGNGVGIGGWRIGRSGRRGSKCQGRNRRQRDYCPDRRHRTPLQNAVGNRQHHHRMVRYNVTLSRSRGSTTALSDWRPVGPAGARVTASRSEKHKARLGWSFVGSFAVHACVAVVLALTARHLPPPAEPTTEMISLVFTPTPPEPEAPAAVPQSSTEVTAPGLAPAAELPNEPSVPDFAAAPPKAQPPPKPETPPTVPQPSPETTVPEPEPPAPADMLPPPPPSMPTPPVTPPKPAPHAPLPRPAPRPRPSSAPSLVPAPAQTQPAPSAPTIPSANPSPPLPISPSWQSALGTWLQANKTYPDEARRRGDEGRATVRFTVNRDGRVLDFQLLSGTGSAILDAAVERLLRGARLPPFPAGMGQDEVTVTLQIRYTLER